MIEWHNFESNAIKDFPMGDTHLRELPVYIPPHYDAKRSEPYPVIFLLAGYGSYSSKFVWENSVFERSLPQKLDQAIHNGDMPDVIIAFPDGSSKLGSSQYINSPVLGNYMDYICDELVAFVDQEYHTHGDAKHRGILGHSSGGFGALVTGMLRPDVFSNICSSAGDSCYEALYPPVITPTINAIEQAGGITEFVEWFLNHPNPGRSGCFEALMALAMCGCYAPNPNIPTIFGDLFFDIKTGALIEEVWQKFLTWDPVHMADKHMDALARLNWIQLDCGAQDEYGMMIGHRQIASKLEKNGIDCTLNEYPGKHGGHSWRNIERISNILKAMAR